MEEMETTVKEMASKLSDCCRIIEGKNVTLQELNSKYTIAIKFSLPLSNVLCWSCIFQIQSY